MLFRSKVNAGITAAGPNTYSVEASSPIVWTNTNVDFKLTPKLTASVSDAGLVGAAAIDYRMNVKFNEQSKLYVNGTVALTGGPSDIRIGYEQKLSAFGTPVTLNGSYGITGEARTSVEVDRFVISVKTTDFNNYSGTLAIKF